MNKAMSKKSVTRIHEQKTPFWLKCVILTSLPDKQRSNLKFSVYLKGLP